MTTAEDIGAAFHKLLTYARDEAGYHYPSVTLSHDAIQAARSKKPVWWAVCSRETEESYGSTPMQAVDRAIAMDKHWDDVTPTTIGKQT